MAHGDSAPSPPTGGGEVVEKAVDGGAVPDVGRSDIQDGDVVDLQQLMDRKKARRQARSQRLKYQVLFKCAAFVLMLSVVMITKWVKEWRGIKDPPVQKRPRAPKEAHGVVLCHGRSSAVHNGQPWEHNQEEMHNYSVPMVVAQQFTRKRKQQEEQEAKAARGEEAVEEKPGGASAQEEDEETTHLYRWWTIDNDPASRPDSVLDASALPAALFEAEQLYAVRALRCPLEVFGEWHARSRSWRFRSSFWVNLFSWLRPGAAVDVSNLLWMLHRYPPEEGGEVGWGGSSEADEEEPEEDGAAKGGDFVPQFFRQSSPSVPEFPPFRKVLFRPESGELLSLTAKRWREDRERLPREVERLLRQHKVDPGWVSWEKRADAYAELRAQGGGDQTGGPFGYQLLLVKERSASWNPDLSTENFFAATTSDGGVAQNSGGWGSAAAEDQERCAADNRGRDL